MMEIPKIDENINTATTETTNEVAEQVTDKSLDVVNIEDAKKKVSDIKVFGDGDTFALLCKASSESQGWMKSTKVCNVYGGCLVQVSTQQKNPDGSYSVAEAVTFVPGNHLVNGKIIKM